MAKTVVDILHKHSHWSELASRLRSIILETGLSETIKWSLPVYTDQNQNIVGLTSTKQFVGIWFFQGVFLKDSLKVLNNAQEGKTKAMRQWRFTSIDQVDTENIKAYIQEAISNHRQGKKVKPERNLTEAIIPDLLKNSLKEHKLLEDFEGFSLSKRREYTNYIDEAKRETTKVKRLLKIIPLIRDGKGLHDQYKK